MDIVAVQVAPIETSTVPIANVKGKKKNSDEKSPVKKTTRVTQSVLTKKELAPNVYV